MSARTDTERLEWLARHAYLDREYAHRGVYYQRVYISTPHPDATLREAIDDAMDAMDAAEHGR